MKNPDEFELRLKIVEAKIESSRAREAAAVGVLNVAINELVQADRCIALALLRLESEPQGALAQMEDLFERHQTVTDYLQRALDIYEQKGNFIE